MLLRPGNELLDRTDVAADVGVGYILFALLFVINTPAVLRLA